MSSNNLNLCLSTQEIKLHSHTEQKTKFEVYILIAGIHRRRTEGTLQDVPGADYFGFGKGTRDEFGC